MLLPEWLDNVCVSCLFVCLSVTSCVFQGRKTFLHSLTWAVSTEQQMFQASSKHWNYCNDVRKILFYFNMWRYISNSSYSGHMNMKIYSLHTHTHQTYQLFWIIQRVKQYYNTRPPNFKLCSWLKYLKYLNLNLSLNLYIWVFLLCFIKFLMRSVHLFCFVFWFVYFTLDAVYKVKLLSYSIMIELKH